LGADSRGSNKPCIRWGSWHGKGCFLRGTLCRSLVTYYTHGECSCPLHARSDMTTRRCSLLPNYFDHLFDVVDLHGRTSFRHYVWALRTRTVKGRCAKTHITTGAQLSQTIAEKRRHAECASVYLEIFGLEVYDRMRKLSSCVSVNARCNFVTDSCHHSDRRSCRSRHNAKRCTVSSRAARHSGRVPSVVYCYL